MLPPSSLHSPRLFPLFRLSWSSPALPSIYFLPISLSLYWLDYEGLYLHYIAASLFLERFSLFCVSRSPRTQDFLPCIDCRSFFLNFAFGCWHPLFKFRFDAWISIDWRPYWLLCFFSFSLSSQLLLLLFSSLSPYSSFPALYAPYWFPLYRPDKGKRIPYQCFPPFLINIYLFLSLALFTFLLLLFWSFLVGSL